jgi:cell pole-organizing protein PopZ
MSKGETASEPSMDEILSSIRKIIAEDEVEEPATAEPGTSTSAAGADDEVEADDDILELTEDDEVTAESEPVADAIDATDDGWSRSPDAADAADAPTAEPAAEHDPLAVDHDPPEGDPGPAEPVEETAAASATTATAPATLKAMTEALLDSGTATAASGALQRLSAAVAPGAALPAGERTIEAFLADMVRPELKAWLDQHLPGLVERIVEREIKKLVRDAQPE